MKKCDIIIPIYNSPQWLKMCVYSLFKNTPDEYIGKVILMNDNSDELTCNCIENLKRKYPEKIEVYKNETNLGFIKNVNKGFDKTDANYVLLLNTDCMLSKNTISKLIDHVEKNPKIGLICPISSNAANISLDMFDGYSFMQMDELLYSNFKGMCFDACTVVGNCLLITRECIDKVGYLDEIYGMGYGDETDYQFKAHSKGFEAKVAIDTYVFHKSEVSFGTSKEKQERVNYNRKIFFDRWGNEYKEKMKIYEKNDPIEYIRKNLKRPKEIEPQVAFFLPDIHQKAGGVHIVVDIVNYLNINGIYATILTEKVYDYQEVMLFAPIKMKYINSVKPKSIVGTVYPSMFFCDTIGKHYNIPVINFMQGYEVCFENGRPYEWAELAYRNSQNILAISNFLKEKCEKNFSKEATVIQNGINIDLSYNNKITTNEIKKITIIFRNNYAKGDFILTEILKQLTLKEYKLEINVVCMIDMMLPINNNSNVKINVIKGPLSRLKITELLNQSDIYIDTSLMEGFGLTALEAMATGTVPIVSESFGVDEYAKDKENCFIIKEINNADRYVEKIDELIANEDLLIEMKKQAQNTALEFDLDKKVDEYINYFKNVKIKNVDLTPIEQEKIKRWEVSESAIFSKNGQETIVTKNPYVSSKRKIYIKFLGLFPKGLKTKIKNILRKLIDE